MLQYLQYSKSDKEESSLVIGKPLSWADSMLQEMERAPEWMINASLE